MIGEFGGGVAANYLADTLCLEAQWIVFLSQHLFTVKYVLAFLFCQIYIRTKMTPSLKRARDETQEVLQER